MGSDSLRLFLTDLATGVLIVSLLSLLAVILVWLLVRR